MSYLELTRAAGAYMEAFVRSNLPDFSEAAVESHRRKGWNGVGVDEAHNAAMFLWHFLDENFLNCRIPENYGSPDALAAALQELKSIVEGFKKQLGDIINNSGDRVAETVPITYRHILQTCHATDETLRQIAEAAQALPSGPAEIISSARPSPLDVVQQIANRFPDVVARLKKRRKDREALIVVDEYDVQYIFQALLTVDFLDVRPEEPTPSVAGGTGRADTLLKSEKMVVEYKCTRAGLGDKELRKQIADDFLLYGKHEDCDILFIFVYDPTQQIQNPKGFEDDLTVKVDGLKELRIAIRR